MHMSRRLVFPFFFSFRILGCGRRGRIHIRLEFLLQHQVIDLGLLLLVLLEYPMSIEIASTFRILLPSSLHLLVSSMFCFLFISAEHGMAAVNCKVLRSLLMSEIYDPVKQQFLLFTICVRRYMFRYAHHTCLFLDTAYSTYVLRNALKILQQASSIVLPHMPAIDYILNPRTWILSHAADSLFDRLQNSCMVRTPAWQVLQHVNKSHIRKPMISFSFWFSACMTGCLCIRTFSRVLLAVLYISNCMSTVFKHEYHLQHALRISHSMAFASKGHKHCRDMRVADDLGKIQHDGSRSSMHACRRQAELQTEVQA